MNNTVHRYYQAGILAIWGSVAVAFVATGRVASYLHPSFHVWTAVAGVVLLLMAAALIFLPAEHADAEGCGGCCEAHPQPKLASMAIPGLILVGPLLAATAISPSQFGAATVMNRGIASSIADLPGYEAAPLFAADDTLPGEEPREMEGGSYLSKNNDGQIIASPIDLLYAANVPEMRSDFNNRPVEVVGQFFPATKNNPKGDRFSLLRMFVMCCAADARPVAINVRTSTPEDFPKMSWVKVVGTATFPMEGGEHVPLIDAVSVLPADPPDETFIY